MKSFSILLGRLHLQYRKDDRFPIDKFGLVSINLNFLLMKHSRFEQPEYVEYVYPHRMNPHREERHRDSFKKLQIYFDIAASITSQFSGMLGAAFAKTTALQKASFSVCLIGGIAKLDEEDGWVKSGVRIPLLPI